MSKSAYQKTRELQDRLLRIAPTITLEDTATLRKAALTLHRWCELECGDSNDYASWAIKRDEATDVPYLVIRPHNASGATRRRKNDLEKGALKRIAAVCQRNGLHYFYQTDPRGWPLYVDKEPLPDNNYNRGIGIGE